MGRLTLFHSFLACIIVVLQQAEAKPVLLTTYPDASTVSGAFSSDGKFMVQMSGDIHFYWDYDDQGAPAQSSSTSLQGGKLLNAISPNFRFGVAGGQLYDLSVSPARQVGGDAKIDAFSADDKLAAGPGPDDSAIVYSFSESGDASLLYTLKDSRSFITSVAFSKDSQFFATGSDDYATRLYKLNQGAEPSLLHTFADATEPIYTLAFSFDSKFLATGSGDNRVQIYNLDSGYVTATLSHASDWIMSVAMSPDGRYFASASYDDTVYLYDFQGGQPKLLQRVGLGGQKADIVSFSPDSKMMAVRLFSNNSYNCQDVNSCKVKLYSLTSNALAVLV